MITQIEIMHEIETIRYPRKVLAIEPDLGDLRKSTDKALPAPPKTPKRVLMKYRFSAIFPLFFAASSFVLALILVLAGRDESTFSGQYLVALNDPTIVRASAYPGVTPSEPSSGTDNMKITHVYYFYLHKVCSESPAIGAERTSRTFEKRCEDFPIAAARLAMLTSAEAPSVNAAVPTDFTKRSLVMMSFTMASVRKAIFASLIVSLIGSLLSAIFAIPGIMFPHSRLLAYMNILWPLLASTFVFLAATILTVLIAGVFAAIDSIVNVDGVEVLQGGSVLLLAWLAWVLVSLSVVYWGLVWFVEVRRSSFTRRKRTEDEVGNWKGIGKEVWTDVKTGKTA